MDSFLYCIVIVHKCNSIDVESLCYAILHVFIDNPVILL